MSEGKAALDAIVVGAGHNGLTAALYLARAGLRVKVLEGAHRLGGMTASVDAPLPGYRHNPHANYLFYQEIAPVVTDFDLAGAGLRWIAPDAQQGLPLADGGAPVVFHRPGLLARTRRSLARHSIKDAAIFAELKLRSDRLTPALARAMFDADPDPALYLDAVRRAYGGLVCARGLGGGCALDLITGLFRSPVVQTALAASVAEFGIELRQPGSDVAFLGASLWMLGRSALPFGGMSSLTNALARRARQYGVEIENDAPATRLLAVGGDVAGVSTSGREFRAPLVLWSGATPALAPLLEEAGLAWPVLRDLGRRLAPVIGVTAVALSAAPRYLSSRRDPDMNACFRTLIGFDTLADVLAQGEELAAGGLPAVAGSVRVNSLWDAEQAPPGRHVAGVDTGFPDPRTVDGETWAAVRAGFPAALIARWRDYAPDLNPVAQAFEIPSDYERRLLIRRGDGYATPLGGLFLCGAGVHPGGGAHGGPGRSGALTALRSRAA